MAHTFSLNNVSSATTKKEEGRGNLSIIEDVFEAFSRKVGAEVIISLVTSLERCMGDSLPQAEHYYPEYSYDGVAYLSSISIDPVKDVWNLSITLKSNNFEWQVIPVLKKLISSEQGKNGWVQLSPQLMQYWPSIEEINKKITGYPPNVYYHHNFEKLEFVSYKDVKEGKIRFSITFEKPCPDKDLEDWKY